MTCGSTRDGADRVKFGNSGSVEIPGASPSLFLSNTGSPWLATISLGYLTTPYTQYWYDVANAVTYLDALYPATVGQVYGDIAIRTKDTGGTMQTRVYIDAETGDFYTNDGTVHSLSDRATKDRLTDFKAGLSAILTLSPGVYRYKPDLRQQQIGPMTAGEFVGLAAQDVKQVIPEAVGSDRGYLTMTTGPIVYALVNAVKELDAALAQVKAELAALKAAGATT
jgi:hypothetical protein